MSTHMRKLVVAIGQAVLAVFLATNVRAATYYVAPGGNDTTGIGTEAAPYKTINKAISVCANNDYSDIVLVKPGSYIPITATGNKKIIIRSTDGADVTIIDGGGSNRCAMLWSGAGVITPNGTASTPAGEVGSDQKRDYNTATNTILRGFTLHNGRVGAGGTKPTNQPDGIGALYNGGNGSWPAYRGGSLWGGSGVRGGTVIDCVISNNYIYSRGVGDYGAAAYSRLENCVITRNTQGNNWAGGAYACFLYGCTVTKNYAQMWGGGIDDCPHAKDCYIAENVAYGNGGSGIYAYYVRGLYENCTVVSNGTGSSPGGGYLMTEGNTSALSESNPAILRNCVIAYSKATQGGAIRTTYPTTIENCDLHHNTASGENGGAVYAAANFKIYDSDIHHNEAGRYGAISAAANGNITVWNSRIHNNTTASGAGAGVGGLYQSIAYNCLIYSNSTARTGIAPGGTYSGYTRSSVVFGNQGNNTTYGGGTYAPTTFYNTIVYGNTASDGTSSDRSTSGSGSTYDYNLIGAGPSTGTGNISGSDPRFYDTTRSMNFRLRSYSPAIFTGGATSTYVGSATTDIEGKERPQNGRVSMGAYEVKWLYENFAGFDLTDGTGDDIVLATAVTFFDLNNYVYRVVAGNTATRRDGSLFDDGTAALAPGTLIFDPRTIVRQGTSATAPGMTAEKTNFTQQDTADSFIRLYAGNSMDIDGNAIPEIFFNKDGVYNQYEGVFTPADGSPYALFPPGIIVDEANNRIIMPGPDYTLYSADDVVVSPATTADVDLMTGILTIKSGMTVAYGGTAVVETPPADTLVTTEGVLIKPAPNGTAATDQNLIYQAGGASHYHQADALLDHDAILDLPVGAIVDLPTDDIPAITIGFPGDYDTVRGIFKPRNYYDTQLNSYNSPIDNHVWAILPAGVRYNPTEVADIVSTPVSGLAVAGPDCVLFSADDILIHGATLDGLDTWTGIISTPAEDVKTETYTSYLPNTASTATTLAEGQGGAVFAYFGTPGSPAQYIRTVALKGNSVTNEPAAQDGELAISVYAGNRVFVSSGDAFVPFIGSVDGPYTLTVDGTGTVMSEETGFTGIAFDVNSAVTAQIFTVTGDTASGEVVGRTGERISVMADIESPNLYFGGGDWGALLTDSAAGDSTTTRTVKLPRYGQNNDIKIPNSTVADVDEYGRFVVSGQYISYRNNLPVEGGAVPSGSVIVSPDIIIRPGSGSVAVNTDGTLSLAAGASIDVDGDGDVPWVVPVAGVYDTVTGAFTPTSAYWQYTEGRDGSYITHYTADGVASGWRQKVVVDANGGLIVSSDTTGSRSPSGSSLTLPLADIVLNKEVNGILDITAVAGDVANATQSPFAGGAARITAMTLPSSVTTFGPSAFKGFSSFNSAFTIPATVTSIGASVFEGWISYNQAFTWPASATTIPANALKDWTAFNQTFTIPEGVTTINTGAFSGWNVYSKALEVPASLASSDNGALFSGAFTRIIFKGTSAFGGQIGTMSEPSYATYIYRANAASWDTVVGNPPVNSGTAVWNAEPIYLIDPIVILNENYAGGSVTTNTLAAGDQYGATLTTPLRSGYTFDAWNDAATGAGADVSSEMTPTPRDHQLFGKWTAHTQNATARYVDNNNGNALVTTANLSGPSDSAIGFTPTNPDANLWILGNVDGPTVYDHDDTADQVITVNMTRKQTSGTFSTTRVITYAGAGTATPAPVTQTLVWNTVEDMVSQITTYTPTGGGYAEQATPAVTGYTPDQATVAALAVTDPVTQQPQNAAVTVTYTAHTYTIAYNGSGATGGSTASSAHTYDVPQTLTRNGFTWAGYNFEGWTRTQGGATAEFSDLAQVSNLTAASGGTVTLYAVWSAAGNIQVNFDLNYSEAGAPPSAIYVTFDSTYGAALPTGITRTGYGFINWFTESVGGAAVTVGTTVSNPNAHTLYAQWEAKSVDVTFYYNDDVTEPVVRPQTYGDNWSLPATPARAGYDFDGWFTSASGGSQLSAGTQVKDLNQTQAHARWNAKKDIVATFDNNYPNAAAPQDIQQTFDAAYTLPTPMPSRTGYEFSGWFTDPAAGALISATVTNAVAHTNWAQWAAITGISVTYEPYNGDAPTYDTYTFDAPYQLPATPTREGYTFAGWWTGAASGSQITNGSVVATATTHTIHAHWTAISGITVNFNSQGGSPATIAPIEVTYGQAYGTLPVVSRTAFNFLGWKLNGTLITAATLVSTATGHVLDADWEAASGGVTVYFDGNGGTPTALSKSATAHLPYGTVITGTSASRTGYEFKGWFTAATGGTKVEEGTDVPEVEEVTLFARWEALSFAVSFNTHAADVAAPAAIQVTYAQTYGTLPVITRLGYDFNGWFTQEANGDLVTGATTVSATAAHTLHAQWTALEMDVIFDGNEGLPASTTSKQTFDSVYRTPSTNPQRTGYSFRGWFTAATGGTQVFGNVTTVKTAVEHRIYAQWDATSYTVTFRFNYAGADIVSSGLQPFGSAYTLPATPERTGYNFKGWYSMSEGGTEITAATPITTADNHSVFAQWTAKSYLVTFDFSYEGAPAAQQISQTYDAKYSLPTTHIRTGYEFSGWFTGVDGGGSKIDATTDVKVTDNTQVLYAKWDPMGNIAVNFDAMADDVVNPSTKYVSFGAGGYGTLPSVSRAGYRFEGWHTAAEGGDRIADNSDVTNADPHMLYARWTALTYTVVYDLGYTAEGVTSESHTETFNAAYAHLTPAPARTGYDFGGWFKDLGFVTAAVTNTTAQNHSIHAKWTAKKVTVQFDEDHAAAAGIADIQQTFDQNYVLPSTPARTGYDFGGWFNAASQLITADSKVSNVDTHTLTASWTAKKYSVGFSLNYDSAPTQPSRDQTYDSTYDLPGNPTRTGYTFAGWYDNASLQGAVVTDATTVATASPHTLYAKWTAITVTAVFNDMVGGSHPITQTYDSAYQFPADPLNTYSNFVGWFTLPTTGGEQITPLSTVKITAETTYYAHWEVMGNIEVSYVLGYAGAPVISPKMVTPTERYGTLATPATRTGYTFSGWYLDLDVESSRIVASSTVTETAAHSLYAKWAAKDVEVGFELNPGGRYDTKTVKFGAAYALPAAAPARGGYTFNGWFTEAAGGTAVTGADTVAVEGPVTLYAQWTAAAFTFDGASYTLTNSIPAVCAFTAPQVEAGMSITNYAVTGGALPDGIVIGGTSFTGTPQAEGTFSAEVTAYGNNGMTATATFNFAVVAGQIVFPGHTGAPEDDIIAPPDSVHPDSGYVIVGDGQVVDHRDTELPFEDPDNLDVVPEGSVVISPDQILRPGTNSVPPTINDDNRTVHLVPGNSIDIDGDGLPPWIVPEEGDWDPDTGIFTPIDGVPPGYLVPPGIGIDDDGLIVPGPNGEYGDEDDVKVAPAGKDDVDNETGIITVPDGALVTTNGAPIIVPPSIIPDPVPEPGIIPPGSLVLPDGTIIIPSVPADDTPSINPDGTVEVGPGDIILIPPYDIPFIVPEPGGTFDPTIPGIHVDDEPPYIILVPSGVIFIEPDTIVMPGNDLDYTEKDDNVYISPVEIEDVDEDGNVHVEDGDTVTVTYGTNVPPNTVVVEGPAVILYPDGTIIKGNNGDSTPKDEDDDGLFEVLPGDEITIPGVTDPENPFIVPELPGWPDKGVPYEYDPTIPGIVGGYPEGVYLIPDGPFVIIGDPDDPDDDAVLFPGDDLDYLTDDDNVLIEPAGIDDLDEYGNVVVTTNDTVDVSYGDGTVVEVDGPALILYPDGTIVKNTDDDGEAPVANPDGTIDVDPGDEIIIPGLIDPENPYVVPELPGYPDGVPYKFDPEVPSITGGEPPVTILIPSGVIIDDNGTPDNHDDDIVTFPGDDLDYNTPDDNVVIKPVNVREDIDPDGNVHVEDGDTVEVEYGDGTVVDVDGPAVILYPDGTIVRNTDDDTPPVITDDGKVEVTPGDEIIIPGVTDPDDPFIVPELPGYPRGLPYEFDPTVPSITGGKPPVTILVPSGVWIDDNDTEDDLDDDIVTFPGNDLDYGTDGDNVTITPVNGSEDVDANGNIAVTTNDTVDVTYGDGTTVTVDGPAVVLYPDGTIVKNENGDDVPTVNPDGTVVVNPGDEIILPGEDPFIVPEIPGSDGPYIFDPTIPGIKGGVPPVLILVPSGIIVEGGDTPEIHDDRLIIPGHTDSKDDDIYVTPGSVSDVDKWGNVIIDDDQEVKHKDGSLFDDGATTVPPGSIITSPDNIVRPGNGDDPTIDADGAILVNPGNTIDIDGDGLPPVEVTVPGWYDPDTGIFTPYDPSLPVTLIPPGATVEDNGQSGFPGHDGLLYTDDDLLVDGTPDENGNIVVGPQGGSHRDTELAFDDGELTLPPAAIVTLPDSIVRPGMGDDPSINDDGTIAVTPGNTIDTDQDGIPPWTVPETGVYNPEESTFVPDTEEYIVHLPSGVYEYPDGTIIVPGPDYVVGNDDDVIIPPGTEESPSIALPWGYVTVPEGSVPTYGDLDETPVAPEVQPGSVILPDGTVIRAGDNDAVPAPVINEDGTISLFVTYEVTGSGAFADGTMIAKTIEQFYGQPYDGPEGNPLWNGAGDYLFAGWLADSGATVVLGTTVVGPDANGTTVFTTWRGVPWLVQLIKNGGTGGTDTVSVGANGNLPNAEAPTRAGYVFLGYFDAAAEGTQYYSDTMTPARQYDLGNIRTMEAAPLHAQWRKAGLDWSLPVEKVIFIENAELTYLEGADAFATATTGDALADAGIVYSALGALPGDFYLFDDGALFGTATLPEGVIAQTNQVLVAATVTVGGQTFTQRVFWKLVVRGPQPPSYIVEQVGDTLIFPGPDGELNGEADDDVWITPGAESDLVVGPDGTVYLPVAEGETVTIEYGDNADYAVIDVEGPAFILYPDGTVIKGGEMNPDGSISIYPGDEIFVPGVTDEMFVVPALPGDEAGPYTYNPDRPSVVGGLPEVEVLIPSGVLYDDGKRTLDDDAIIMPGADLDYTDGANVVIVPAYPENVADNGNVTIGTGTVVTVTYPDGTVKTVEGPATILYPDGTIIKDNGGGDGDGDGDGDGTIKVYPGDEIDIPGMEDPFVVPQIPGDDGPYIYDPTIPAVIGGEPTMVVDIPSGVFIDPGADGEYGTDDDSVIFPGKDEDYATTEDNVVIHPATGEDLDDDGNVIVGPFDVVTVTYPDGSEIPVGGPAVILYPDGTIVKGATEDDVNPDGTVIVNPGDVIILPGEDPITVPNLPGDNDDYIFDPTVPSITGGDPEIEILIPEMVIIDDGSIILPGKDGDITTFEDNVVVTPATKDDLDEQGNIIVGDGDTVTVFYPEDGEVVVDGPALILNPDGTIVYPGEGNELPTGNDDGTVNVNPGDVIVIPGEDPFVVPQIPGADGPYIYDPTIPGIIGGEPPVTILIPSGVIIDDNGTPGDPTDDTVKLPGPDGVFGTDDDVTVTPVDTSKYPDSDGNIYIEDGDTAEVTYGTGDDARTITVDGPAVILAPDGKVVINTSGNGELPTVNPDGTVAITPGDIIHLPDYEDPYIVPDFPGRDTEYVFDPDYDGILVPNFPVIVGGAEELVVIIIPENVAIFGTDTEDGTDDKVIMPGDDLIYFDVNTPGAQDDNVIIVPAGIGDVDVNRNVIVDEGQTVTVIYENGDGESIVVDGPAVILYPNGVIVKGGTDVDGDGKPEVKPGDEILVPGEPPFVVPEIPGDPGPYEYDPEIPAIIGSGEPPVIVPIPGGVVIIPDDPDTPEDEGKVILPGEDGVLGGGDDVIVAPAGQDDLDDDGNVIVEEGEEMTVTYPDGTEVPVTGPAIILNPDGTIIYPGDGNPTPSDTDDDGLINVNPGDVIVIPGEPPFVVPEIPGDPGPYEYDPEIPAIIGNGEPPAVVTIPDGVITIPDDPETPGTDESATIVPGHDGQGGTPDDIVIKPGDGNGADEHGNIVVGPDDTVTHLDPELPFEDGDNSVPPGSIISVPDVIVRPGEGAENPSVNEDGTIHVVPGNTIDIDQDGKPPYVVTEEGDYDPETGILIPDDGEPAVIYIPSGVEEKGDGSVVIPGPDGVTGTEDDIIVPPGADGESAEVTQPWGYVTVPEGSVPTDWTDSPIEPEVQPGSVILPDGTIIRAGDDPAVPPPAINDDGTISVWAIFTLTGESAWSDDEPFSYKLVEQTYGKPYTLPDAPAWTGTVGGPYAFKGWTSEFGYTLDSATTVGADSNGETLYSLWSGLQFKVTLNMMGGREGTTEVSVEFNSAMPTGASIVAPVRDGYTFLGYFNTQTNRADSVQYYTADMESAHVYDLGNPTTLEAAPLYAHWQQHVLQYAGGVIIVTNGVYNLSAPGFATATGADGIHYEVSAAESDALAATGLSVWSDGTLAGTPVLPLVGEQQDFNVWVNASANGGLAAGASWIIRVVRPYVVFEGADDTTADDDIVIRPVGDQPWDSSDPYVVTPEDLTGHADGSAFDDGKTTLPEGTIVASPNDIVRPGTGDLPSVNPDGSIDIKPGNTIDLDGDGMPPWTAPEDGTYYPETNTFVPDNTDHEEVIVPPDGWDVNIESIRVDKAAGVIDLGWPNSPSPQSVIYAKVALDDGLPWTRLENGADSVEIRTDSATIPIDLGDGATGTFHFFKRRIEKPTL